MARYKREEIKLTNEEFEKLRKISQSRKEETRRVQRANILLRSYEGKNDCQIARDMDLDYKTVLHCRQRCLAMGAIAALEDLPKSGRPKAITIEAVTWILSLGCQKPCDLGLAQETWSTRVFAKYIREHCAGEGHKCLEKLSISTLWEILNDADIKPHKVQYYCDKKDPEFDRKRDKVLKVYKEVEITNKKTRKKMCR
jgi:transposase